ncbi:6338_t:CDS:2 [Entrophospora sp. SA101]|nr:6338_t:CDS:2 [Entrophospora sp. SA101]
MIKYPLEDKEELEKSIIAETNDFLNILKRDLRPNTRFFATISSNNSANAVDDGGELTNKGKRKKPDTTVEKNKSKKRDKKIKNKMVIDSVIDDANKQPKLSEEENLETIKEKQNKKKQRKTSMTPVTSKMKNPGSLSMILNLDNNITFDQSNIHSTTTNSSISSDDE